MTIAAGLARHAPGLVDASPAAGLRIGDAARLVGVSPSSLRSWERQGLVSPHRTPSGYRRYGSADIERLRLVRRLRDERINAPGIRRLVSSPADGRGRARRAPDGRRVRGFRQAAGLSLRDAGELTGLSVSFLSAIERNATGVSVSTLQRLTAAYGVTLLDLLEAPAASSRQVAPAERRVLELDRGVRIEQLAETSELLEPQLFVLAPGATSQGEYAHAGEEFVFVLDGALTFWVGERERYRLRTGDALTFPSTLPHRWRNRVDRETRLLWINTPPTF